MPDPHVSRQFKELGTGDDYDPKAPYGKCIDCREAVSPDSAPFCHNCQELHQDVFPVGQATKSNTDARLSRKRRGLFVAQGRKEGEERARMERFRVDKKKKRESGDLS